VRSRAPFFGRDASAGVSRRLFALGLGPLDHVDMSAVGALKQQNRGESVVEPGQLPGELHARRATTTDQPRLWLVVHALRTCDLDAGDFIMSAVACQACDASFRPPTALARPRATDGRRLMADDGRLLCILIETELWKAALQAVEKPRQRQKARERAK
jgi:hypothetical protein